MQMMRTRSQGLAAMARSSLSRNGAPLLPPGCHRRHLLCVPDQMQKVWLPESFRGARTSPGSDIAINGERLFRNALSHPLEEEMARLIKQGKALPPNIVLHNDTIKSASCSSLSTVPPSCAEVIHLMDDSFPEYLTDMFKAF